MANCLFDSSKMVPVFQDLEEILRDHVCSHSRMPLTNLMEFSGPSLVLASFVSLFSFFLLRVLCPFLFIHHRHCSALCIVQSTHDQCLRHLRHYLLGPSWKRDHVQHLLCARRPSDCHQQRPRSPADEPHRHRCGSWDSSDLHRDRLLWK